ncbi:MAG: PHP domain-containing protein [Elusimicrobiales bacterium]|nr:PHP domain-containing protein [Elusimicrobiales bacterium]MCK5106147.1 PHP domain-containing protein [Elusimicrobiales bacterium]
MPSVNLHTHSSFSDGTLAPCDVLKRAQAAGVEFFSITDHDTVDNWKSSEYSLSDYKLKIVRGTEISTSFHDNLHMLGFGIDIEDENFLSKLTEYKNRRIKRVEKVVEILKDLGMDISLEELSIKDNFSYGRPHIADCLIKKHIVRNRKEAFQKYLGYEKPAYVPSTGPSIEESIKIIKDAGGYAVLAHPGAVKNLINLEEFKEMGLDGIEAFYPTHSGSAIRYFIEEAKKLSLFITAGSDYHGPGSGRDSLTGFDIEESLMGKLRERFL